MQDVKSGRWPPEILDKPRKWTGKNNENDRSAKAKRANG